MNNFLLVLFTSATTFFLNDIAHNQREQTFVLKCAMQGGLVKDAVTDADYKAHPVCIVRDQIKDEFK